MKSLREQFEEEYMPVWEERADAGRGRVRYVYCAPWYIWDLPEQEWKRKKQQLAVLSIGSLFLLIFAGTRNTYANAMVLVQIAGTCAVGFHVPELFRVIQLLSVKERTSRMNYYHIDHVMKTIPLVRGILLLTAGVAGGWATGTREIQDCLVTLCYLLCGIMALCVFKEYREIPFRTEKNTNGCG
ncbi:MAG: hypothetical protein LUC94_09020 [Clostridiales bacterium]|nr:hypothetical protein [Clostridiales bacterium]